MKDWIKKILVKSQRILYSILAIAITIGMFLGILFFFRWIGWKGILGFVIGGLMMGYVMISKNPMIVVYRDYYLNK